MVMEYISDLAKEGAMFILSTVWNGIHTISYPVLLTIAIFALTMYIAGYKSFGKAVPASLIIFTLIRAIGRM